MKDRIIALAALLQAVEQVQLMANQGQAQTDPLATCINSLIAFDAGKGLVTVIERGGRLALRVKHADAESRLEPSHLTHPWKPDPHAADP